MLFTLRCDQSTCNSRATTCAACSAAGLLHAPHAQQQGDNTRGMLSSSTLAPCTAAEPMVCMCFGSAAAGGVRLEGSGPHGGVLGGWGERCGRTAQVGALELVNTAKAGVLVLVNTVQAGVLVRRLHTDGWTTAGHRILQVQHERPFKMPCTDAVTPGLLTRLGAPLAVRMWESLWIVALTSQRRPQT